MSSSLSSTAKKTFQSITNPNSPALHFEVVAQWRKARVGKLYLPHGVVDTPVFMPVGTQAAMKGISTSQLEDIGCGIILANAYHVGNRPGSELVADHGGVQKFMNWKGGNHLTDSGGFQMVSLNALMEIKEEGVTFQSPFDGSEMLLTPEESIRIQNNIGADIIMQLDDVVSSKIGVGPRIEEAMHRSIRWLDRCIDAHVNKDSQNLFPILQGGLDHELRKICVKEMLKRDHPGIAIGGLSGGESKDEFWKVVDLCTTEIQRESKGSKPFPVYTMGVGYAVDLVVTSALGVDMADCVFPTRTARFGRALVPSGSLNLKSTAFANDFRPIDEDCDCMVCQQYTRAYVHILASRDPTGLQLISYHNIAFQMRLMRMIRESIIENRFVEWVCWFMDENYPDGEYPGWVVDSLMAAGIDLVNKCEVEEEVTEEGDKMETE